MFPTSSGRSGLRSSLRSLLGLLVIGLLAVLLIAWSNQVEVSVDGETTSVRTYASTVADVLDNLDVELETGDEISHDLATPVDEGMQITIDRARTVEIFVDGFPAHRVVAPVTSVAGALEAADLDDVREQDAEIVPGWTAPIEDGDVIKIWHPQQITLEVDGDTIQLASLVADVDALLTEQGIELGDDDRLNVDPETPLFFIDQVLVERVEYVEEVEEVVLDHDEQRRETNDLNRGSTQVEREGADGLREDTYEVMLVDGEEVDRELVSQEVVTEPQDRVVLVGTYDPPPPPPSPSRSTSSSATTTRSAPTGVPAASDPVWDRLAQCESNGNWSANSGNGYYGGIQFHPQTWRSVGGSGLPHEASRSEQIYRAQRLLSQSWATWGNQFPACSRQLGLS